MPIEQVIWKINEAPERLSTSSLEDEEQLEEMIFKNTAILDENWLLIGRQVQTGYNKDIDLLAIDRAGSLIIIELKKGQTSRDVVGQVVDYATWVQTLKIEDLADIYRRFSNKYGLILKDLGQAFLNKFQIGLDEDQIKGLHQMVIVASTLDPTSERVVEYLNTRGVPINVAFFRVFKDGANKYLSRVWFMNPAETQESSITIGSRISWNGHYYVSFGHEMGRHWEDARKYGFISGGGGKWYSQTLNLLKKGDNVWVNIPRKGYVGVGVVEEPAVIVSDFTVHTEKGEVNLLKAPINADYLEPWIDDEEKAEYVVRVKWIRDLPINKAISETGFFGSQHTVCRPKTQKWNHTVERLKALLKIKESELETI